MQILPVKTRIMRPPHDDLFAVLDEFLGDVSEGDVVALSSKIVAIGEGNCIDIDQQDKANLVAKEADFTIPRDYWPSPLTIKHHAFIGNAGIDVSNADGYRVLLPKDPFVSARAVGEYLTDRFSLNRVGVIVADSHSTPLRRGATGVALGWWGVQPTINHVGKEDLFGRAMEVEVSNIVDGLAAAATVVMGEVAECQPIVILRDVPALTFTAKDTKRDLFVPYEEDMFRVLYERWLEE